MKAIFNDHIIDFEDINLSPLNRGFRYGDGLFETISVINYKLLLFNRHITRLQEGCEILNINLPEHFNTNHLKKGVEELLQSQKPTANFILRIYVWREGIGLYAPSSNDGSFLITAEASIYKNFTVLVNVDFAREVWNVQTKYSKFKTINALNYVMAGIEKQQRKLDEIIITDQNGFVSEALASNIFWKQNGNYFTPPLETGCVEGIMRNWLMERFNKVGEHIEEKRILPKQLMEADSIFTTNSNGIHHIKKLTGKIFHLDKRIIQYFKDSI